MTLKHEIKIELDKAFFMGGRATFTVESPNGSHYTFKIKTPKFNPDLRSAFLLTGPDNENSYTYIGMVNRFNGQFRLTQASKMSLDSQPVKVLSWALSHVFGDGMLPVGYAIHHEGKCGCCGRTLTVPESIKRGIGPECWSRMGGM